MKRKIFPDTCALCGHVTPTGMCRILFEKAMADEKDNKEFHRNHKTFHVRYSKRRHDCPLLPQEVK
jgi:hypothetical protein